MVRTTPPLVYYDKVDGTYIKVGTGSWQIWLNNNRSFRYESFWGSFTACKEQQGEEIFWLANRHVQERARSVYLGGSKDLTVDNLVDIAKQLTTSDTSCWECKSQTNKTCDTNSTDSKAITKEIETKAVRQWCIFYTHPDGRVEFMGGCWEKEQALTQLQNLKKQAYHSESIGNHPSVPSGRYYVKEELVLPVNYTMKSSETNSFDTNATPKEVELLYQLSELQKQYSELQKQVDQQRRLNANPNDAVKLIWN